MSGRDTASSLDSTPDDERGSNSTDSAPNRTAQDGSTNDRAAGPSGESDDTASDDASQAGTPDPASQQSLSRDSVFEILKNERRRTTLTYLLEHDGPVKLDDLAEHVAVRENDTTLQALTSTERKRAYVGLYQCHLPKMDDLEAVEFDRERGIIELGPNVDRLEPYLDGTAGPGPDPGPWPRYYLALAGANTAVFVASFGAALLIGGGLPALVALAAGALAVVSFAALAVVHHVRPGEGVPAAGLDPE